MLGSLSIKSARIILQISALHVPTYVQPKHNADNDDISSDSSVNTICSNFSYTPDAESPCPANDNPKPKILPNLSILDLSFSSFNAAAYKAKHISDSDFIPLQLMSIVEYAPGII